MITAFTRFSCSDEDPRQHATGGQNNQNRNHGQAS